MAQDITLLGANYSAVPAVELPKTGGGTASFTDVTDTTAAAADVAQGKYFYDSAGVRTEGTASGGGGYVLKWKASGNNSPAIRGIYENVVGVEIDCNGVATAAPAIAYSAFANTDIRIIYKNVANLTGSPFGDFLRQSPCASYVDFGNGAPQTMLRMFYQWGYSQDGNFHSGTVTVVNLRLDNFSSNNNSFNPGGSYDRKFDVYFTGQLKNDVNINTWNALNADSWNRLIECLYDYSGGTAHTLTVGNTLKQYIDSEHMALATSRNWTIA